jgi:hypothetical protein
MTPPHTVKRPLALAPLRHAANTNEAMLQEEVQTARRRSREWTNKEGRRMCT